jgi:hypothetical protein
MSFAGRPFFARSSAPPIAILGPSLVHWVRFDLDQVTLASGRISAARDRLAHNDTSQATAGLRPTWVASGQNDRPYADFNAANHGNLARTTGFSGWNAGDGVYVWCVAKWDTLGDFEMTSNYTPTAGAYDTGATVRKNNNNACQFFVNLGGGVGIKSVVTANNTINSVNTYFIEGWIDPSAGQIRCSINGGAAVSTAVTNFGLAQPIGRVALGARADTNADSFDGRIYEVGAAKTWSPAAQSALRQYFIGYYGL